MENEALKNENQALLDKKNPMEKRRIKFVINKKIRISTCFE